MMTDPPWALAELERVMGPERVQTWNARTRQPGGEWDVIRALPPRSRRRLQGAGWFSSTGLGPDVAAGVISASVPDTSTTCAAMEWYCRTALIAIGESRREARQARDVRRLRRLGLPTVYAERVARAVEEGYGSLWQRRKALGWAENRRPRWRPTNGHIFPD